MTVEKLIEELSKYDGKKEVVIFASYGEYEEITFIQEFTDHIMIDTVEEEL